jgi:dipeptidyl aminopeptidase/acylaminoacyl peptidase
LPAEERIQIALENWAPRFVANGVDFNDLRHIATRVERWDDWCRVWSECGAEHARLGHAAESRGDYTSAGEHYLRAAITYHFGKYLFMHRPDELRAAHERVVDLYQRAAPYCDPPGERVAIPYEFGAMMPGMLRKPWHSSRPPVVILIPGLDSVKEELHAYGEYFLRRGMAVLAIDGPGQGEMEFTHPIRHDYEVPIRHAIDYLERRADIDASRVGLMGVSLGGYYAPRAAAFEPRVQAAIAIAGAYRFADHFDQLPVLTREAFTARLHAPDQAAARSMLERLDLEGVLGRITCPLLVIMGRKDRLAPPESADRMAREAGGDTELWMFDDGNHVCNNIPYKYRPQQADWMRRKLSA